MAVNRTMTGSADSRDDIKVIEELESAEEGEATAQTHHACTNIPHSLTHSLPHTNNHITHNRLLMISLY